jgi:hypothetical protein
VGRHERLHARVPDHRPEVHVLVELEADPQEQVAFQDPGPHARVADGAEQDRVAALQALEIGVREHLARPEEPIRAQVELDEFGVEAVANRLEDPQTLRDDLGACAVPPDHADPVAHAPTSAPGASSVGRIWSARLIAAR